MSKYRLRIPRAEQNELERVPMEAALQIERHLERIAELAPQTSANDPVWTGSRDPQTGLLRFEWGEFRVLYQLDRATQSVVVTSVKRIQSLAAHRAKSNV